MGVLMVIVVDMAVLMFKRLMSVDMSVVFGQVKP